MKNKYMNHSRISEKKFREILRLFCLDIEAKKVAIMTNKEYEVFAGEGPKVKYLFLECLKGEKGLYPSHQKLLCG